MRLNELKCKNCGAAINVKENSKHAKCAYCHASFVIEDAYDEGYKFEKGRMKAQDEQIETKMKQASGLFGTIGKVFAVHYIVTAIIAFIIIAAVVFTIIFAVVKNGNKVDEFDISRFNNRYEIYKGSEFGSQVNSLIDEVTTNNKKEKEHKITVKYNDISTQKPEELKNLKKQFNTFDMYEVVFEYDQDGFIYLVSIEE